MRNKERSGSRKLVQYRYILITALFLLILFVLYRYNKSNIWDGQSRFTFVSQYLAQMGSSTLSYLVVFSIEPSQKRAVYLVIPRNTKMEIPYGYKSYPAHSVYSLGELDPKRGGSFLLMKAVETTLAVAVDGYILSGDKFFLELPYFKEELLQFKHRNFSITNLFSFARNFIFSNKLKSNLSLVDKVRLFNAVRKIRIDQIRFINLEKSNAVEEIVLPDGSNILQIDPIIADVLIADDFQNMGIRNDDMTIEVQNATGQEKIAAWFSRLLENMGANVILKTTAKKNLQEMCQLKLYRQDIKNSTLISLLKKKYNCSLVFREEKNIQSDLKVILGENLIQ